MADHDKVSPEDKEGDTLRKVRDVVCSNPLGLVMPTPGREIENFLPPGLVCELHGCDQSLGRGPELEMEEAEKSGSEEYFWRYFDVKLGIDTRRCEQAGKSEETLHWIKSKYRKYQVDDEIKIAGFGGSVATTFLADGGAQSRFFKYMQTSAWLSLNGEFLEQLALVLVGAPRTFVT